MNAIHNRTITSTLCALALLIVAQPAFAYPTDPDNAALYYYQAFLLRPQPAGAVRDVLADAAKGEIEPNREFEEYIGSCRDAVYYATVAAELPGCNWGLKYSDGFSASFPHLAQIRQLAFVIVADARILAARGDYRQALERCMTVRKMAGHVGDEIIVSFLVATAVNRIAEECIQDLLVRIQDDPQMLAWLGTHLATVPTRPLSIKATLQYEQSVALDVMRLENLQELKGLLLENNPDPNLAAQIDNLDEAFFEQNRRYYKEFIDSFQMILDRRAPYAETHGELEKLDERAMADSLEDPAAALTHAIAPAMWKVYDADVRALAGLNALKAAVKIYLVKAKTGQMPKALPGGLSKDPFSGRDFAYEVKKSGFVLRCGARDINKDKIHEFEFGI